MSWNLVVWRRRADNLVYDRRYEKVASLLQSLLGLLLCAVDMRLGAGEWCCYFCCLVKAWHTSCVLDHWVLEVSCIPARPVN